VKKKSLQKKYNHFIKKPKMQKDQILFCQQETDNPSNWENRGTRGEGGRPKTQGGGEEIDREHILNDARNMRRGRPGVEKEKQKSGM